MKNLTKSILIFFIGLTLLGGCASTNYNYFQDGKPSGKGEGEGTVSVGVSSAVNYKINDEIGKPPEIEIKEEIKASPLVAIQGQIGATDNIDFGGALGLTASSINARIFSKVCLLKKKHKVGIGLLPALNFSFTPDSLFGCFDVPQSLNANFSFSIPISFDLSDNVTFVLRPNYASEWSRVYTTDNDDTDDEKEYKKNFKYKSRGIAVGLKIRLKNSDKFIYPEVSFITYDKGVHYYPFIGIAFGAGGPEGLLGNSENDDDSGMN